MAKPVQVEDSTFQHEVLDSPLPVVVYFWAEWCGPCKALGAALEEVAEGYAGQARFVKLNADDNYESAARYGVQSLPTLIIFHDGREVHRVLGAPSRPNLQRQLERALGVPVA